MRARPAAAGLPALLPRANAGTLQVPAFFVTPRGCHALHHPGTEPQDRGRPAEAAGAFRLRLGLWLRLPAGRSGSRGRRALALDAARRAPLVAHLEKVPG